MKPEGSQKVRAALEQLRQQRAAAAENRTEPTPPKQQRAPSRLSAITGTMVSIPPCDGRGTKGRQKVGGLPALRDYGR